MNPLCTSSTLVYFIKYDSLCTKIKRIKFLRIGKKLFLALTFFRNNILSVENITFMTGIYLEKIILRIDEVNFNLIKILSKLYKIASSGP